MQFRIYRRVRQTQEKNVERESVIEYKIENKIDIAGKTFHFPNA